MTRRPGFISAARPFALGLALAGALALCDAPSQAFEPPPGSKNFTPPNFVPNYFSNEAAPFGRATQAATPAADRFNTAPVAPSGGYAATPQPSASTAATAGRSAYRGGPSRGGAGHVRTASSRTARTHARGARVGGAHVGTARGGSAFAHGSARPAYRQPAAQTARAAAGRSSRGSHGAGHLRQASR